MARRREAEEPEPITLFIDECLGRRDVPEALAKIGGVTVELHSDHFPAGTEDVDWIPDIAARQWVILTKDERISRRRIEIEAWKRARAAVCILSAGKLTGEEMGAAFVAALPKIRRWVSSYVWPVIIGVSQAGNPDVKYGDRRGGVKKDKLNLD